MKQSLNKPIDLVSEKLVFPGYSSPKIDGVRGVITQFGIRKKDFSLFENKPLQDLIKNSDNSLTGLLSGFDCEITVGEILGNSRLCAETAGFLLSKERLIPDSLRFNVLDLGEANKDDFINRLKQVYNRSCLARDDFEDSELFKRLVFVEQTLVLNEEELMREHRRNIELGYEGTCYKTASNIYRFKRATAKDGFFRIKDFIQEDAVILDITEGKGIKSGMVGSFTCKDVKSGKSITVAAGVLVDSERRSIYEDRENYIGRTLSYKYMNYGIKDKPRFPTFVHFRVD